MHGRQSDIPLSQATFSVLLVTFFLKIHLSYLDPSPPLTHRETHMRTWMSSWSFLVLSVSGTVPNTECVLKKCLNGTALNELMALLWVSTKGRKSRQAFFFIHSRRLQILVQSLSRVQLFATPWTAAHQTSPSFTISQSLLILMSIELTMPSNHLILCCPLPLPSISPSIRVFSNELALRIRWPKYWSYSISPSNEYSELISFRVDWFDFLAVQETQESSPAPQFKSISPSAFSLYCPSLKSIHDYWKNHSFDYMDFVGKVMSVLFNMLSMFVIAFLPRSKHL